MIKKVAIPSAYNYNCTFNPFDKWAEAVEENKKLYEKLLKERAGKGGDAGEVFGREEAR